jgi:sugar-specific transcriptional regulator TrmB
MLHQGDTHESGGNAIFSAENTSIIKVFRFLKICLDLKVFLYYITTQVIIKCGVTMQDDILNRLIEFGLSEREAKVYLALLNRRNATLADLQKLSGIPQCKMSEIVRRLVRQGYCLERRSGKKRTFEVLDPKTALAARVPQIELQLQRARGLIEELSQRFTSEADSPDPGEFIEILHGSENIHHHYCRLLKNARREVLGFGRPPYTCSSPEKVEEQGRETESFLKRGGVSRWVYQVDAENQTWLYPGLKFLQKRGVEIRMAERLPLKMMIFDRSEVFVAQENLFVPRGELTMAIIKNSAISNAFHILFDFFWEQAEELDLWMKRELLRAKKMRPQKPTNLARS